MKDAIQLINESKVALPRALTFKKVEFKALEQTSASIAAGATLSSQFQALVTESFIIYGINASGAANVRVNMLGVDDKPVLDIDSRAFAMNAQDTYELVPSVVIPEGKQVTVKTTNNTSGAVTDWVIQLKALRLER